MFNILYIKCDYDIKDFVCANAFNEEERTQEVVKCVLVLQDRAANNNELIDVVVDYDCTVVDDFKVGEYKYISIKVKLELVSSKPIDYSPDSYFIWDILEESTHHKLDFKNEKMIPLNFTSNLYQNTSKASLVLYDISVDSKYKICPVIPDLIEEEKICCKVIKTEEHEENTVFMSLLVIGVLLVIYAIVIIVTWQCPTKNDSIDTILQELPTKHVEALKQLVEADEEIQNEGIPRAERRQSVANVNVIRFDIENPAYEQGNDEDDIDYKLRMEALKIRRMSRASVADIQTVSNKDVKKRRGVKFTDESTIIGMGDIENLKMKILNESNRRASVAPFKKAYDLTVSSDDSD